MYFVQNHEIVFFYKLTLRNQKGMTRRKYIAKDKKKYEA